MPLPLVKEVHLHAPFFVVDLHLFPFWSFILHYFFLLHVWQSILNSMKNKNQQNKIIYLQLTSTFTVRFDAVPIPLYVVQRYVPLLFLLVSRTN